MASDGHFVIVDVPSASYTLEVRALSRTLPFTPVPRSLPANALAHHHRLQSAASSSPPRLPCPFLTPAATPLSAWPGGAPDAPLPAAARRRQQAVQGQRPRPPARPHQRYVENVTGGQRFFFGSAPFLQPQPNHLLSFSPTLSPILARLPTPPSLALPQPCRPRSCPTPRRTASQSPLGRRSPFSKSLQPGASSPSSSTPWCAAVAPLCGRDHGALQC